MLTTTDRPTTRRAVLERIRPWWLWVATAFSFPPAGYLAHQVVGPVEDVGSALVNGLLTGALIGAAQWTVLRRRGAPPHWIIATAAGFGVGLACGAALVGYETSLAALIVMGAVCGACIGVAQAAAFPRLRRHGLSWTLATAALWTIGWSVTTSAGIDVEDQWPVFGISGALIVTVLQSVLINRLTPASDHAAADHA